MADYNYKRRKYVNGVDYDKNVDYSAEMEKAKAAGDTDRLASLEEKRNRKIEGEGLSERKTYNYIDIGTKIEEGIRNNISPVEMKELVDARRDKAYQNKQYDIYKNDEIQKRGLKYYYDAESGAGAGHSNRPEEKNSYEDRINSLLSRISNVKSFEYNPEEDAAYKALQKQMQNESRRAATDVLADIQQQGGGKSSYAVSAATLAANNYNAKLTEEIPRLAELAYNRYQDSIENDRKALEYALKASEAEHKAYMDSLDQFNSDREFSLESYEKALDRYAEEEDREFEKQMELEKNALNREKEARDTIQHYEKSGVPAPIELLKEAGMENYGGVNQQSASVYRTKLDLEAIVKNKQIANYNARTTKTYNDMSLANEKFVYQQEKDKKENGTKTVINSTEDVFKANMTNGRTSEGVYIGSQLVKMADFIAACQSGEIVEVPNGDGTYTYKFAEKK